MFKNFEEINVGDKESLSKKITLKDILRFAEITGDHNPLHIDSSYAQTTPFKEIVAHGMLGASFISTLIGTKLPGKGALWISHNFDFLLPVRVGDTIYIQSQVLKKNDGEQILELETRITNQNGQLVLQGVGKVKLLKTGPKSDYDSVREKSRVALVTGGGGGIGSAICQKLASQGVKVIVNFLENEERANLVVEKIISAGGSAIALAGNICHKDEVQRLLDFSLANYGSIDILVNNASSKVMPKSFDKLEWSDFLVHMNTQLQGAFNLTQACAPSMIQNKWGRVVNITSEVVEGQPIPNWTAYSVAKSALSTFSKHLALELGPSGVTVNNVSPGMTDAGLIGDISEKMQLIMARQSPLRRLGDPKDVASAVAYLASDEGRHVTGQTILVNGGHVMR